MRIGILSSAQGSAFFASRKIIENYYPGKHEYFIITDRECGTESQCVSTNISYVRIEYKNRREFSDNLFLYLESIGGVDVIFLYFLRIITEKIFTNFICLNIHPALLPAFKGLDAIEQFLKSGSKFLGASLHLVDQGIDTGKIIAQVQTPVTHNISTEQANKISFLQKVYLTLLGIELLENMSISFTKDFSNFSLADKLHYTVSANPAIQDNCIQKGFEDLQKAEDTFIINRNN